MSNKVRTSENAPIYGVGINDFNGGVKVGKKHLPAYESWFGMLKRCYDEKAKARKRNSKYNGCTVVDEWHRFSAFKKWFEDPENGWRQGYCLDKDIIVPGNKIYGPQYCLFVPPEINQMITFNRGDDGLPLGVHYNKTLRKYTCCVNNPLTGELEHIGTFPSIDDAFNAYKERKEKYIQLVAKIYFEEGAITERAFNALMSFKVQKFTK